MHGETVKFIWVQFFGNYKMWTDYYTKGQFSLAGFYTASNCSDTYHSSKYCKLERNVCGNKMYKPHLCTVFFTEE